MRSPASHSARRHQRSPADEGCSRGRPGQTDPAVSAKGEAVAPNPYAFPRQPDRRKLAVERRSHPSSKAAVSQPRPWECPCTPGGRSRRSRSQLRGSEGPHSSSLCGSSLGHQASRTTEFRPTRRMEIAGAHAFSVCPAEEIPWSFQMAHAAMAHVKTHVGAVRVASTLKGRFRRIWDECEEERGLCFVPNLPDRQRSPWMSRDAATPDTPLKERFAFAVRVGSAPLTRPGLRRGRIIQIRNWAPAHRASSMRTKRPFPRSFASLFSSTRSITLTFFVFLGKISCAILTPSALVCR
jgi:hypothetical protein